MLVKLKEPFQDIPAGYQVNLLDDKTCIVMFQGQMRKVSIPANMLDMQSTPAQHELPPIDSPPFGEIGVSITCRCGAITRHIAVADIRSFAKERAAINYVISLCSVCSR